MTSAKKEWARGDGDTWDIVTSVGYTALAVAAMRAVATSHPQPLARDDFAQHFVRAAGEPYLMELMADYAGESEASTANWPAFFGIQMRFFDTFFAEATASCVRQVVILAAGLDARAYRLQWPTATHIFEVDQPEVLAFKSRVLAERGARPGAERHEVPVDLRDDWVGALRDAGFDPQAPTAWLLEGLLMYLPGPAHDALFGRIDEHSAPGSRLATHVFTRIGDCAPGILPLGPQLDPFSEINIDRLVYDDDRLDPPKWLTTRGWRVQTATASELGERYGKPLSGISQELDQVASSASYLSAVR
ncbi:class I SAM-dependent methyltransferase [Mycobacterium avium]|uniref:class I SAM-dependent methyltransferase n=1 Tax=Mycobacterium avium TaxID=1764 RepID=UPI001CC79A42|nr:class I SAM-dependent methyltransferase [Mycobacterium avium]MBZ4521826.1 class I SAM-dependent methyltransferase [Mycobacterium avium subsp. hominissuis]MBZ4531162.1 class I SAM-dependent methyltransferase [Mycobacterium avium subsp. hominissuis]